MAGAIGSYLQALQRQDDEALCVEALHALRTAHFQAPQAEVRALLVRALRERLVDSGELLTPATSLLECAPALQQCMACVQRGEPMSQALQAALADDALLIALLTHDTPTSIPLERVLTQLRRQLLADACAPAASAPAPVLALHCALAWQCFINEYVWAVGAEETAQLRELHRALAACAAGGGRPPPGQLAAAAAYSPLASVPGAQAWAQEPWPAPLAALLTQQIAEPAIEARLRSSLRRLGSVQDTVSLGVQAQYEANPYPRWVQMPRAPAPVDIRRWMQQQFPHAPPLRPARDDRLDVLVAGSGTGQHSIGTAQQFAGAQVLAVDLSSASLGYAQRKADALGLGNIEHLQADILQLGALDRRFDLIESAGVLHHMADPLAGWRVLQGLLRPGGCMAVGLYSALGRREVVAARQRLAGSALPSSAEDIRRGRQALMHDDVAPQFPRLLASRDFHTLSACRDLLFHVQEHCFSLPQIAAMLQALGLHFIGFELEPGVLAAYRQRFPADPDGTDLAQWHLFEQAHPDTFVRMYRLWVRQPG